MGVLWTVLPLDNEIKSWLEELGLAYPGGSSRLPTGQEVKEVISSLKEFDIEIIDNGIGAHWQAAIVSKLGGRNDEWTLLNINEYSGDNEEQKLWFDKGSERLITQILEELSRKTGPLVLIADTEGDPLIISVSSA